MRPLLLTMTASVGLVIFLTTSPANSITISAPAGIRQAADALDLTEAVHCRKYSHRHRQGHGWSRGCRVGAVSIGPRRSGVVVRDRSTPTTPGVSAPSLVGRPPGNVINPEQSARPLRQQQSPRHDPATRDQSARYEISVKIVRARAISGCRADAAVLPPGAQE
jgi:hypothetical protein